MREESIEKVVPGPGVLVSLRVNMSSVRVKHVQEQLLAGEALPHIREILRIQRSSFHGSSEIRVGQIIAEGRFDR